MSRHLRPKQDAILIPKLLITEVMRLVCIPARIKAQRFHISNPCRNFFCRKGMGTAQFMFIFGNTMDEDRLSVDEQLVRSTRLYPFPPASRAYANACFYPVKDASSLLDNGFHRIQIRIFGIPESGFSYLEG